MLFPFVLEHALVKIARYSDAQGMAPAGHDVREIQALMHGRRLLSIRLAGCDNGNRGSFPFALLRVRMTPRASANVAEFGLAGVSSPMRKVWPPSIALS